MAEALRVAHNIDRREIAPELNIRQQRVARLVECQFVVG